MKYIVMDYRDRELFTEEFETEAEAIEAAEAEWNHLSEHDKSRRESFIVLESINPDEDAENHLDGDVIKRWK